MATNNAINNATSPTMIISTDFTSSARFTKTGGGTASYGSNGNPVGVNIEPSAASGNYVELMWPIFPDASGKVFLPGSKFSTSIFFNQPFGTTGQCYVGLGTCTTAGSGHTFTTSHIGFKFLTAAGTTSLYATTADGSETASSALDTFSATTAWDLMVNIESASSVTFYYRKNGAASWSTTTLTTNIPTATENRAQFSISNANTANNGQFQTSGATFQR